MINLFIGVDRYEMVAYHVAAHSIMRNSTVPISVTPLYKHNLHKILWRERDPLQSTDFAFSRFLVPYLSGYHGISIFMDCDVLVKCDLNELYIKCIHDLNTPSIWCVKHDYTPKTERKFLDQEQTVYDKKNWSSVMVFNNEKCRVLTPDYVNEAHGLALHQFKWLQSDDLIVELPLEYNWLVGEYPHNDDAKILHYTQGTPCFKKYVNCDHAIDWWDELDKMNSCVQHVDREVKV